MAKGLLCMNCGWQETVHLHGGSVLAEQERNEMSVLRPGYTLTQLECMMSYCASPEEIESIESDIRTIGDS